MTGRYINQAVKISAHSLSLKKRLWPLEGFQIR
jgi:hypothetical protein